MIEKDFFFNDIYVENSASISLINAIVLAQKVSPDFFTEQLNRILKKYHSHLVVDHDSSNPNFLDFIKKLVNQKIGFIEIYACQDVNNNVKATLACDIFLSNGLISVKPHWCAWKDSRAAEIVSTLLVPLHLKNLQEKTHIRWDDGKTETLIQQQSYQLELNKVFMLAKYPSMTDYYGDNGAYYKICLEIATEIGRSTKELTDDAYNSYKEKVRHMRQDFKN